MSVAAFDQDPKAQLRSDVLIVGSGAGGAAAAFRLARAGLSVIVLEKGMSLPLDGSTLDVERVVRRGEFLSREPWLDGAGRRFCPEEHFNVGGKTKWYGAALFRFAPHEFQPESNAGYLGWPIGYADLEPYYCEAEALLGVREFPVEPDLQRILSRLGRRSPGWHAAQMPMGLSSAISQYPQEAAHFDGFASARHLKSDAEESLLRPLLAAGQVRVLTGAEVNTLLGGESELDRVVGVRLTDGREFYARHVVLAAGALHSPRILQRFLIASGLDVRLAMAVNVGANLKLHLLTALVAVSLSRKTDLLRKTVSLTHERYPHSSVQPLGFDGELIARLVPSFVPRFIAQAVGSRAYGFFLQTEDASDPRNRITARSREDASLPQLDYDEQRGPRAADEHRRMAGAFQRALLAAGFLSFRRRIGFAGTAHACGTLRCGESADTSVVDSSGRVHGLRGLYVVDGSVLPRVSRVNPALTIYAWGLRVAALIADAERALRSPSPAAQVALSQASA